MTEEKREGILLSLLPYLGDKKIIRVFTSEEGLLTFMVKSARHRSIVPFCIGEWVYKKSQGEIHSLIDCTLLDPLLSLKTDYCLLKEAGQIAQDLLQTQLPSKRGAELYDLSAAYLKKLILFANPKIASASFRLKLLHFEGLLSLKPTCACCPSSALHFSQGESYCRSHAPVSSLPFNPVEWDQLLLLSFSRQFSQLQALTDAPFSKIDRLFQELGEIR